MQSKSHQCEKSIFDFFLEKMIMIRRMRICSVHVYTCKYLPHPVDHHHEEERQLTRYSVMKGEAMEPTRDIMKAVLLPRVLTSVG